MMEVSIIELVNLDRPYGYVYLTQCSVNNKSYIGQHVYNTTIPVEGVSESQLKLYRESHGHDMFKIDPNYLGSGKLLWKAINKYGWNNFYVLDILDIAKDKDELDRLESDWISWYRHLGESLYNIAPGGRGGNIIGNLPKEQYDALCEKQRQLSLKPNHPFRHSTIGELNPMFGKHHSEESKEKNRQWHLNHKASEETRRKMSENRKNNPKFRPPESKGMIYVNNGEYSKRINPEELDYYLNIGFLRGRKSYK